MKLNVKFDGKWNAVPCGDGDKKISWLIEEMSKRVGTKATTAKSVCHTVLPNGEPCYLDNNDLIKEVLGDQSFVYLADANVLLLNANGYPFQLLSGSLYIMLDGCSLKPEDLVKLGKGELKIKLTDESWKKVKDARDLLDEIVAENRVAYGVTTGFGKFARVVVPKEKLVALQENLIRSHACGVGEPLSIERARMLFALRINILSKGYSGISTESIERMINIFNAFCVPYVPEQGTVGASGDLAPLAHLALGMMGEGKMWSPKSGWAEAKDVLESYGLKKIELKPKEGLALINGTQLITGLGAEAIERAAAIARQADIIAAMTLEVLKGSTKAFDKAIHDVRPHKGQIKVAETLRSLLHSEVFSSEIAESHRFCDRVQDAYTLRCCPQVHGVAHDTIEFVKGILTTEMNSATDNPMVFAEKGETMSGGNFHGEYPAKALDYLAIGIHELANMSERRTDRLMNPSYSDLPAFLVEDGGFNSVSENKTLCHPASVDSLTTSAGTEDHVSMGGWAARKALKVIENVERVMAIELMSACQGIDILRPLKTTEPLEALYKLVRATCKKLDGDRYMADDMENIAELLRKEKVWEVVNPYLKLYKKQYCPESEFVAPHSPTSVAVEQEPEVKRFKTD
eukprot:gene6363-7091_t